VLQICYSNGSNPYLTGLAPVIPSPELSPPRKAAQSDFERPGSTPSGLSWHCGSNVALLSASVTRGTALAGGPALTRALTSLFRTMSSARTAIFRCPLITKKQADRVLIESADGLLSPVDTSALRA
jgi:hypothetical protein